MVIWLIKFNNIFVLASEYRYLTFDMGFGGSVDIFQAQIMDLMASLNLYEHTWMIC
jgi:hypothetical protein